MIRVYVHAATSDISALLLRVLREDRLSVSNAISRPLPDYTPMTPLGIITSFEVTHISNGDPHWNRMCEVMDEAMRTEPYFVGMLISSSGLTRLFTMFQNNPHARSGSRDPRAAPVPPVQVRLPSPVEATPTPKGRRPVVVKQPVQPEHNVYTKAQQSVDDPNDTE